MTPLYKYDLPKHMVFLFCFGKEMSTVTWILEFKSKFWQEIEYILWICHVRCVSWKYTSWIMYKSVLCTISLNTCLRTMWYIKWNWSQHWEETDSAFWSTWYGFISAMRVICMSLKRFYFKQVISPNIMGAEHFQYCRYCKCLIKLRRKGPEGRNREES